MAGGTWRREVRLQVSVRELVLTMRGQILSNRAVSPASGRRYSMTVRYGGAVAVADAGTKRPEDGRGQRVGVSIVRR
jgi:hypothetical protein